MCSNSGLLEEHSSFPEGELSKVWSKEKVPSRLRTLTSHIQNLVADIADILLAAVLGNVPRLVALVTPVHSFIQTPSVLAIEVLSSFCNLHAMKHKNCTKKTITCFLPHDTLSQSVHTCIDSQISQLPHKSHLLHLRHLLVPYSLPPPPPPSLRAPGWGNPV